MEAIIGWSIVGVLILDIIIAIPFTKVAEKKGYENVYNKYFWIAFLFGPVGIVYITALPDLKVRTMLNELISAKNKDDVQKAKEKQKETRTVVNSSLEEELPEL